MALGVLRSAGDNGRGASRQGRHGCRHGSDPGSRQKSGRPLEDHAGKAVRILGDDTPKRGANC
jgi:hypothetical protein